MDPLPCWQDGCPWRGATFTEVADHHYRHHRLPDPPPLTLETAVIGTTPTRPRWLDVRTLALTVHRNGTHPPGQGGTTDGA